MLKCFKCGHKGHAQDPECLGPRTVPGGRKEWCRCKNKASAPAAPAPIATAKEGRGGK